MIRNPKAALRAYQGLAVATAICAYLLILLGGLVRISGAGLACPDWPLCHGRLIPPLQGPILIEYSHRLLAAVVSGLVLVTVVAAFHVRRLASRAASMALWILGILAVQIVLGALTVKLQLTPVLVVAHLGVAALFLAALVIQAVGALRETADVAPVAPSFHRLVQAAAVATYIMMLIGGYVASSGAGLACPDLPLCRQSALLLPDPGAQAHMLHRGWALLVTALVAATAAAAPGQGGRAIVAAARFAAALVGLQLVLGALNVATGLSPPIRGAHLGVGALLFGTLIVLSALSGPLPARAHGPQGSRGLRKALPTIAGGSIDETTGTVEWPFRRDLRSRVQTVAALVRDYTALMKPRIILLLLVTTATTMIVAAPHGVTLKIVLLTLLGGTLAAGSANAFNMYVDRDIDAVMQRTCLRPVPAGRLRATQALGFGAVTGVLSIGVMAWGVNLLSAVLSTAGILFYVGVYSLWLKRTTPQNIVIGGAAGAVPPLVGWAAATGHLALPAVALFTIVFLWTPPHFWALALGKTEDYRAAGIPMLPVVRGDDATRRQILAYSVLLTATTLTMVFPLHALGAFYLVATVALDALFLALAVAVAAGRSPRAAASLFGYSILYLALLFGAMVADRLILG
jgi:heme o synthase